MKLLEKLLLVIASASLMVSTPAVGNTYNMGTLSPTAQQQADFYATSSFADIFNFTVGTEYQTVLASAVNYAPDGTGAGQTHVTDLTLTLYAGSDATGSVMGEVSSSNGSMIDLSQALVAGDYSARIAGVADGQLGGGYLVSVAAVPEPAGWMMLLCGLMVVAFIARRKTDFVAS